MSTLFGGSDLSALELKESDLPFAEQFTGPLSAFGELLDDAGLTRDVKPGHTVFAFTNKAYKKLLKQLDASQGRSELDDDEKRAIARYHVSPEAVPYEDALLPSLDTQIDTLQGSPLAMSYENDCVLVRDVRQQAARAVAAVSTSDEQEGRKHLYIIDAVLVPTAAMMMPPIDRA